VEAAWAYAERHAARKKIRASDMLDDLFRDEAAEAWAEVAHLRALLAAYGRAVEDASEIERRVALLDIEEEAAKWREWVPTEEKRS
jgi:hypothetical protein